MIANVFLLETPLREIIARGAAVYLVLTVVLRLIPKRQTGNVSANDMIAQDTPTLLIHNGQLVRENLRKEKLTEQELAAVLRKHGMDDLARVKQAVLEADGEISVVEKG